MSNDAIYLDILAAREELDLLRKIKSLKDSNGLAFYRPHPKQELFHRAGKYKRRYVRSGNRFGKSDMGAAEDCAFARGERPWFDISDPARFEGIPRHATKGCIVVQDWDKAHEIFTNNEPGESRGKIFKWLPADSIIKVKKGRSGTGIAEITVKSIHGTNSTIHIETVRSFMQNPMGLESSAWDWIHVDEPCPYDMWTAMARGLIDRAGSAWFTCTPITEPWINDYFVPRSLTRATLDAPLINDEDRKWVITGSSYDNPFIKAEEIKSYEKDLTPEEITCRIQGIPLALSGLVYKDFDNTKHIYRDCPHGWTDAQTPPTNYTIRTFIDCHPKTPHAVLHFATSPTGHTFIFRELFRPGLIDEIVEHIEAQVTGYFVEDFLIDPSAYISNPITGTSMADEFYRVGLPVSPAPKDLAYGIIKTQQKFRERDADGNPTIYVHESCEEFLYEIDRYTWRKDKETPVDKDDHMMENLYRAVLTGLSYVEEQKSVPNYKPFDVSYDSWQASASELSHTYALPDGPAISKLDRYPI